MFCCDEVTLDCDIMFESKEIEKLRISSFCCDELTLECGIMFEFIKGSKCERTAKLSPYHLAVQLFLQELRSAQNKSTQKTSYTVAAHCLQTITFIFER